MLGSTFILPSAHTASRTTVSTVCGVYLYRVASFSLLPFCSSIFIGVIFNVLYIRLLTLKITIKIHAIK